MLVNAYIDVKKEAKRIIVGVRKEKIKHLVDK